MRCTKFYGDQYLILGDLYISIDQIQKYNSNFLEEIVELVKNANKILKHF